jgi:tetratricopeptide (TPR) repeat protein
MASYKEAIRLDPKEAKAHNNLGLPLYKQGDLVGAVACFKEALRLDPKLAPAHVGLGFALRQQGHFREALTALRRGHDLHQPTTDPRLPALRQSIRECQLLLEYDCLLPAVLRGEASPATATDGLWLAWLAQQPYKGTYAASARFYRDAFTAQPRLAADLRVGSRYYATRAAALAGCGRGKDAGSLGEAERAAWRRQALEWLRADLAAWDKRAANQAVVRQTMQHWQKDAALAGVRDKEGLGKLPVDERAAWEKLWADVDALRKRPQE